MRGRLQQDHGSVQLDRDREFNPGEAPATLLANLLDGTLEAMAGDDALGHELQDVLGRPYGEQSHDEDAKEYRLRPQEFTSAGGVSHCSCSS